jgi:Uma2 family endonuclease
MAITGERPPRLEHGDRLTRREFERRRDAMPKRGKAELIEGIVHMPSPASPDSYASPSSDVIGWLEPYRAATTGVRGGHRGQLRLDADNMPQPDVFLFVHSKHGGQTRMDRDGHVVGAPELITEIVANSASYALFNKLDAYRRSGVREYLVWRVLDQAIDWFILRDGRYDRLAPDAGGLYKSEVFPGLWLDPAALLRGDLATVAQVQQQGLASTEHAAFVARLQERAARGG